MPLSNCRGKGEREKEDGAKREVVHIELSKESPSLQELNPTWILFPQMAE